MQEDRAQAHEHALVMSGLVQHEPVIWKCRYELRKYWGDIDPANPPEPYEIIDKEGNLLVTNGANLLWNGLIGTAITVFSNANARLGVGDSATAATAADTDLNAATNKLRKAADATFPSVATNVLTMQSTFLTTDANFHWQEWGMFNAASGATSMLNHAVTDLGTKTSAASWTLKVTLSLA